jgi:hypothetical protein
MSHVNKTPDFLKMAVDLKRNASRYAATEAVNFFKNSFTKGGFTDIAFVPWSKPTNPLAGYRILYKSGDLQRSVRKQSESVDRVVIQSDLSYSEIHNNGGYIAVTQQMKKFFWAKYYELTGKVKTTKSGKDSASKSNIKLSEKAKFCKAMALMEVGSKIKIEKRQYMGESRTMMDGFEKWFAGHVEIVFKDNLNDK